MNWKARHTRGKLSVNRKLNHAEFRGRVHSFLTRNYGEWGNRLFDTGKDIVDENERSLFYGRLIEELAARKRGTGSKLRNMVDWRWQPVDMHTFITDPYYMNKSDDIYPKVLEELTEINSGKYVEVVLTGGIGCAKTTCALYTVAYQLYLLSCLKNPHRMYGLDPSSEILFVFQSINGKISLASFRRFQSMIEGCQYFREEFPPDPNLKSKLVFPSRIEVVPVSGSETAAIGQNVMGGLIDELNYMSVTEKSKQSVDHGVYDQAVALYNSIARRRKSRFLRGGALPGILCLVSSKRYPGQFTDLKEVEAKKDPTIYIYDYRVWDVKPRGSFGEERFRVFAGDLGRKPRILKKDEVVPDQDEHLVVEVPVEYREDFQRDIINALREIAGVSTLARHPYIIDVEAVTAGFGKHPSIFSRDSVDFVETHLLVYPKAFFRPELPRAAHIDLAISGDSAGLAIGTVVGFKTLKQLGYGETGNEMMPLLHYDAILEIKPPKNGEILFWKIREILVGLMKLGLNLRWVTLDTFQSKDTMQLLRQQGLATGTLSDADNYAGYDFLKNAFYTSRVAAPEHEHARIELVSLEKDSKTGKIDHPPTGSKDCSDAMAGVAHTLTTRREIWGLFDVPWMNVPSEVRKNLDKNMTEVAANEEIAA